jgi:hypothetical protein
MVAAVTVSLIAVGTILGAYAVTNREIAASYLGTRPASATLEIPTGVDAALLEEVRKHPAVAEAEARDVIVARMRVGNEWRRTLLFVVDDFDDLRLNLFRSESGAWPPPDGTMLLERLSLPVFETAQGRRVLVKAPHGEPRELTVSGVVHDPGLAPSYMERTGYAYVTRRASSELGESPALRELRIELRGRPVDPAVVRAQASEVAQWVSSRGYPVHQIRIPPPAQHPHQKQMATVLLDDALLRRTGASAERNPDVEFTHGHARSPGARDRRDEDHRREDGPDCGTLHGSRRRARTDVGGPLPSRERPGSARLLGRDGPPAQHREHGRLDSGLGMRFPSAEPAGSPSGRRSTITG